MIRLAHIIETFEVGFLQQYTGKLLARQQQALAAIKDCRSAMSPKMQVECGGCDQPCISLDILISCQRIRACDELVPNRRL